MSLSIVTFKTTKAGKVRCVKTHLELPSNIAAEKAEKKMLLTWNKLKGRPADWTPHLGRDWFSYARNLTVQLFGAVDPKLEGTTLAWLQNDLLYPARGRLYNCQDCGLCTCRKVARGRIPLRCPECRREEELDQKRKCREKSRDRKSLRLTRG